ncbi:MAG TPA: sigma-54 dependent transcriptional regulator [Polyangiaceae bacterium]|nr:sigma-54 dependent transcriptional regulator [Polyangiaceae bacterium]
MTLVASFGEAGARPKEDVRSIPSILVVDDDKDTCDLITTAIGSRSLFVSALQDPREALERLDTEDHQVLLVDINMEGMSGLELCRAALRKRPDLMVIVMTGFGSVEHAVEAMRAGAHDFVTKPAPMDALRMTVERALRHRAMRDELQRLRLRVGQRELPNVIGNSPEIRRLAELVNRVAATDSSILITGESGTGKELVARALHEASGRNGPFLAINCAALPDSLLESELFGYMRGAFTDARTNRAGLFVEAEGGTLVLDEIGETSLSMQAKLLRVLQERRVRPLGSSSEVAYDARIVTATNRDLEQLVHQGTFREDLFYRVNVLHLEVPALRDRTGDILLLAQFFLERAAQRTGKPVTKFGSDVAELLLGYSWPGNVRELENAIERAVALARFDTVTVDDLPPKICEEQPVAQALAGEHDGELVPMHVVEERYVRKVLQVLNGNKTKAAKALGVDRRTLYRMLERLDGTAPADGQPRS